MIICSVTCNGYSSPALIPSKYMLIIIINHTHVIIIVLRQYKDNIFQNFLTLKVNCIDVLQQMYKELCQTNNYIPICIFNHLSDVLLYHMMKSIATIVPFICQLVFSIPITLHVYASKKCSPDYYNAFTIIISVVPSYQIYSNFHWLCFHRRIYILYYYTSSIFIRQPRNIIGQFQLMHSPIILPTSTECTPRPRGEKNKKLSHPYYHT